ncbi:MAG: hypothetical protein LBQ40_03420 [Clostridiales bacterium]|jgi:cell division septum initiation protein DivIVA|nr:hypothetical protein [Clostridiales bacterium]
MDKLESLLLEIEDEITKGKKFFGSTLINDKNRILSLLDSVRKEIPEVIREAEATLKNKNSILQDAIELSMRRTQQAQEEADYMVSTSAINMKAKEEAVRIIESADKRAYEIEMFSKQRIDELLSSVEQVLKSHLDLVRNNREELSGELLKRYVPAKIEITEE